jgi:DNA-binding MarR family transcriptional regulator
VTRQHRPPPPQPKEATRRRWANKREHVLRRLDSDPTFTASARSVARAIAQFSDAAAKPCWPGQKTLAKMLGVATKTVQRAVAELETGGYVGVRRHPVRYYPERRGFARKTNCYVLRMPKGPIEDYRPGQRRRYRSQEWKQRAAAWCEAHRQSSPLEDSGGVLSPSEGAYPGARTRNCEPPHDRAAHQSAGNPIEPRDQPAENTWTGVMSPEIEALIAATRVKLRNPFRSKIP